VDTLDDEFNADGVVRCEAIHAANENSAADVACQAVTTADTIDFSVNGTISLTARSPSLPVVRC
jgi:hypothetical protein